jgi:hypothetical protein
VPDPCFAVASNVHLNGLGHWRHAAGSWTQDLPQLLDTLPRNLLYRNLRISQPFSRFPSEMPPKIMVNQSWRFQRCSHTSSDSKDKVTMSVCTWK